MAVATIFYHFEPLLTTQQVINLIKISVKCLLLNKNVFFEAVSPGKEGCFPEKAFIAWMLSCGNPVLIFTA